MFNDSFEIEKEYNTYLSKVNNHSVKDSCQESDSWVISYYFGTKEGVETNGDSNKKDNK